MLEEGWQATVVAIYEEAKAREAMGANQQIKQRAIRQMEERSQLALNGQAAMSQRGIRLSPPQKTTTAMLALTQNDLHQ